MRIGEWTQSTKGNPRTGIRGFSSRDGGPWTLDSPGGFDVLQFVVLRLERWTADIEPRTSNLEPLP
jgi:hypothetical protein